MRIVTVTIESMQYRLIVFAVMLLSWKVAPALAVGNCIIFKPSEFTPLTALLFAKLAHEAGFPPGVVNVINGTGTKVGQPITEHMEIEKVRANFSLEVSYD